MHNIIIEDESEQDNTLENWENIIREEDQQRQQQCRRHSENSIAVDDENADAEWSRRIDIQEFITRREVIDDRSENAALMEALKNYLWSQKGSTV